MKRCVVLIVLALVSPKVTEACPVVQAQSCHAQVAVQAVPVQVQAVHVQAAPVMVQAVPVQVQSYAVQAAPVQVQSYGVATSSVLTQSAVQQPIVVQSHQAPVVVRAQRARPVRSRSVTIQRSRTGGLGLF